jgi:pimeloyl-ACP methyl ester carboxylesterase
MTKGMFNSRDGTPIYYEVHGEGRPLFLCYGLLCRREHWSHQLPFFAARYQVIVIDYRGHQRSGLPRNDKNLTIEWCAKDVQDTADLLGLKEFSCLGHSMGVPVLAHLTQWEPVRLKANVFICGSVNNPFEQMLFTGRLDSVFSASASIFEKAPFVAESAWRRLTQRNRVSDFIAAQLGFNPDVALKDDVASYLEGVQQSRPEVFYRLMLDYRAVDRRALLQESKVPCLVVAGDEDCITPLPVQEEMARLLPKGQFVRVAGGSHNAHMDFPDFVNERIQAFFKKVGY